MRSSESKTLFTCSRARVRKPRWQSTLVVHPDGKGDVVSQDGREDTKFQTSRGIHYSVIFGKNSHSRQWKSGGQKPQGHILVQNTYNFLPKTIVLAVRVCAKEINEGPPKEQQQQGSEGPASFTYLFPSHAGGERGFGLVNVLLMILKEIPEPGSCSSHGGKENENALMSVRLVSAGTVRESSPVQLRPMAELLLLNRFCLLKVWPLSFSTRRGKSCINDASPLMSLNQGEQNLTCRESWLMEWRNGHHCLDLFIRSYGLVLPGCGLPPEPTPPARVEVSWLPSSLPSGQSRVL